MVGQEHFENRLGTAFSVSFLPYLSGSGQVVTGSEPEGVSVDWELNLSSSGEAILIVSFDDFLLELDPPAFELTGLSNDGRYQISCKEPFITNVRQDIDEDGEQVVLTCKPHLVELTQPGWSEGSVSGIEAFVLNFAFEGLERTVLENGWKLDKFRVLVEDTEVVFQHRPNYNRVRELLKGKVIDRAILSSITIPVGQGCDIDGAERILETILQMLSLVNINANFCRIMVYTDSDGREKWAVRDVISSPYHRNVVIDDRMNRMGLNKFIEICYDSFSDLDRAINMKIFVSNLLGTYEGKFLENKIAGLIMTYEYLLTRYLIFSGHDKKKIRDLSIQDKLNRLDGILRFIQSEFLGDEFRSEIRNPLFHQGDLSFLSWEDKVSFFREYLDLLIRITLRILGYSGEYISPIDYELRSV